MELYPQSLTSQLPIRPALFVTSLQKRGYEELQSTRLHFELGKIITSIKTKCKNYDQTVVRFRPACLDIYNA